MTDDGIHKVDGPYPIEKGNEAYYPIMSFSSRDAFFLLEFAIKLFSLNEDYHIANVYSKLMSVDDWVTCYLEDTEEWEYLE